MKKMTMMDYILETPDKAIDNIEHYQELTQTLVEYAQNIGMKRLVLVASGSSYNACHCARNYLMNTLNLEVKIITPYTFTYYEHHVEEHDVVFVISQSGYSTNAIAALQKLKEIGCPTIALTGNPDHDIKDYADLVIDYGVGEELVGYVTKGVTSLCLYLMLFAIAYSGKTNKLEELKKAINLNKEMIHKAKDFVQEHYKDFSSMHQIYVCGAGANYGTALEGALKCGETIHIPALPLEIEEYIHGPNLQLTPSYTILLFDGNDEASERVKTIYQASRAVSEHSFLISNHKALREDHNVLSLSDTVECDLAPLVYLPFVQVLAATISQDLNSVKQHPLMRQFKSYADAKTASFVNYDEDD